MRKYSIPWSVWLSIVALSLATFYFLGIGYGSVHGFGKGIISLGFAFMLVLAARSSLKEFFLVALTAPTLFLSLACGVGSLERFPSPLHLPVILDLWAMVVLTGGVSIGVWKLYAANPSPRRFASVLLAVFCFNWIVLAFNVKYFDDWKLENYLTVPFVIILYVTHRRFRLSNVSHGLIFLYMMLHIYGSHYTYAEVPFGFWMQDFLAMSRNHYDRIVHFAFGFLLAYPIREMVIRITNAKGFWGFYIPVEFVLAFSALYEIIEWLIAVIYGGDLGIAYLGTQGDVWDAIKDMALAGSGSVIAMGIIFVILFSYRGRKFWGEIIASLSVKHLAPLGEEALEKLGRKKN